LTFHCIYLLRVDFHCQTLRPEISDNLFSFLGGQQLERFLDVLEWLDTGVSHNVECSSSEI